MAKYDDPDALDTTIHSLKRDSEFLQSQKQDSIKTVSARPNSGNMKRNEIQMFDDGENIKLVFRNDSGALFQANLEKMDEY